MTKICEYFSQFYSFAARRVRKQTLIFIFPIILISCFGCSQSNDYLLGYIEGEYTYIASEASGTLQKLFVSRGQIVQTGELLYQLDPQPEEAEVNIEKANIADLEAQVHYFKTQLERQQQLYPKLATTKVNLDQAMKDFKSKSQELVASQARLFQTKWKLNQKKIRAPVSGLVFDTFYRIGENTQANMPILAILNPENIKVLFYIPETLLKKIHIGQQIYFNCDGCDHASTATINYISPEAQYTPPIIYSKDTRYKLIYLVRAALPKKSATHFHPGQPIQVFLHP